jgi:hypothetical protein
MRRRLQEFWHIVRRGRGRQLQRCRPRLHFFIVFEGCSFNADLLQYRSTACSQQSKLPAAAGCKRVTPPRRSGWTAACNGVAQHWQQARARPRSSWGCSECAAACLRGCDSSRAGTYMLLHESAGRCGPQHASYPRLLRDDHDLHCESSVNLCKPPPLLSSLTHSAAVSQRRSAAAKAQTTGRDVAG